MTKEQFLEIIEYLKENKYILTEKIEQEIIESELYKNIKTKTDDKMLLTIQLIAEIQKSNITGDEDIDRFIDNLSEDEREEFNEAAVKSIKMTDKEINKSHIMLLVLSVVEIVVISFICRDNLILSALLLLIPAKTLKDSFDIKNMQKEINEFYEEM